MEINPHQLRDTLERSPNAFHRIENGFIVKLGRNRSKTLVFHRDETFFTSFFCFGFCDLPEMILIDKFLFAICLSYKLFCVKISGKESDAY